MLILQMRYTLFENFEWNFYISIWECVKYLRDRLIIYWRNCFKSKMSFLSKRKSENSFIINIYGSWDKSTLFQESYLFCHIWLTSICSTEQTLWCIKSCWYKIENGIGFYRESHWVKYKISRILEYCDEFEGFIDVALLNIHELKNSF